MCHGEKSSIVHYTENNSCSKNTCPCERTQETLGADMRTRMQAGGKGVPHPLDEVHYAENKWQSTHRQHATRKT